MDSHSGTFQGFLVWSGILIHLGICTSKLVPGDIPGSAVGRGISEKIQGKVETMLLSEALWKRMDT